MRKLSYLLLLSGALLSLALLPPDHEEGEDLPRTAIFNEAKSPWADSLIQTMSLEEKIGQLFMVAAYSNKDEQHVQEIETLIRDHHIGGLIFMQGGPLRQAILTNRYQALAKVPLLLSMDAEWGLGMRLDSTLFYPRQLTLGASNNDDLVYDFGREQARQLKRLGVHVSFSPVIDVNSNPDNPVIGNRSFGEDRELVSRLGYAYMSGLQDGGVLANAKHFPGHGDTDSDSHKTLPSILHDRDRLDSLELYPFRRLFDAGIGSVMVAHLDVPALEPEPGTPSTLSYKIVTELLRDELGFDGLVFTDALNMAGVANSVEPGEAEYRALLAGNDVLLFAGDVPKAVNYILQAIEEGRIDEAQIDEHCLRILKAKEWAGAHFRTEVELNGLHDDLTGPQAQSVQRKVIESGMTIVRNKGILPVLRDASQSVAIVTFTDRNDQHFAEQLSTQIQAETFRYPKNPDFKTSQVMEQALSEFDLVIFSLTDASGSPSRNWGVSNQSVRIINSVSRKTKVAVNIFTNAYALRKSRGLEEADLIVVGWHDHPAVQAACADLYLGAAIAGGKLPVNCGNYFPLASGMPMQDLVRLRRTVPEFVGWSSSDLERIDSIALSGIEQQAYPGCRVLAIKDGNIIVDRSYGHLTYEKKTAVDRNTVYDLASITKIAASTLSMMHLQDQGLIDLDYSLCDYIDLPDTAACYNMNLREMLSHTAGLPAWIPFYQNTLEKGKLLPSLYRHAEGNEFKTEVIDGLYIRDSYVDSIYNTILRASVKPEQRYKYSDLGYYFVKRIVERKTGHTLDAFTDSIFYRPMGLSSLGYHPLERIPLERIAPTEYDLLFRKKLVHGYVHDPGAAMLGGVAGHAGLFSNAEDLGILMYMLMKGGSYGGRSYLQSATIDEYNTCYYCEENIRRGVGFDKPPVDGKTGPCAEDASQNSFGHSGFTGTLAWADPDLDLVYVFLSNRVYPNADNNKLLKLDIRTNIHQVLYDAHLSAERRQHQSLMGYTGQ